MGVLMLNLVIGLWPSHAPSSAQEAKQLVYKVMDVLRETHPLQSALNEYGSGGWEFVDVAMGDIQVPKLIFKK